MTERESVRFDGEGKKENERRRTVSTPHGEALGNDACLRIVVREEEARAAIGVGHHRPVLDHDVDCAG